MITIGTIKEKSKYVCRAYARSESSQRFFSSKTAKIRAG